MHISRCLLMRGLVRSYHQELVEGEGGGGEEKERLDTAPQTHSWQLLLRRQLITLLSPYCY